MQDEVQTENANESEANDTIDIINIITSQLSKTLLTEFLKLPKEARTGLVLVKSAQLLMANSLCQVVDSKDELEQLIAEHTAEIKTLTLKCAQIGFSRILSSVKH